MLQKERQKEETVGFSVNSQLQFGMANVMTGATGTKSALKLTEKLLRGRHKKERFFMYAFMAIAAAPSTANNQLVKETRERQHAEMESLRRRG